MRISVEDFDMLLREVIARPTTFRLGQAMYVYATQLFGARFMSTLTSSGPADPFYRDVNIPRFVHWLWTGEELDENWLPYNPLVDPTSAAYQERQVMEAARRRAAARREVLEDSTDAE